MAEFTSPSPDFYKRIEKLTSSPGAKAIPLGGSTFAILPGVAAKDANGMATTDRLRIVMPRPKGVDEKRVSAELSGPNSDVRLTIRSLPSAAPGTLEFYVPESQRPGPFDQLTLTELGKGGQLLKSHEFQINPRSFEKAFEAAYPGASGTESPHGHGRTRIEVETQRTERDSVTTGIRIIPGP